MVGEENSAENSPEAEQNYQNQIQSEKMRLESEQLNQSMSYDQGNGGIAAEQLSLKAEMIAIQNLLQGKVEVYDDQGFSKWKSPTDESDILLTPAGVQCCLNTIQFYLNKNTLLSNYDEDTILNKMEDFGTSLADLLFMRYERYFRMPNESKIQAKLQSLVDRRIREEEYNSEFKGKEIDEEKLRIDILNEIDLPRERDKIKRQMVNDTLKGFDLLMRNIQDLVHSTYLRALFGQERRTLRQHIHVSETLSPQRTGGNNSGGVFNWFKKK